MANTYCVQSFKVATSATINLCLLGIWNPVGSGKIYKLYRAWITQMHYTTGITAAFFKFELRRFTALPTFTTTNCLFSAYDSANQTSLVVPTNISYGYTAAAVTDATPGLIRTSVIVVDEQEAKTSQTLEGINYIPNSYASTIFNAGEHNQQAVIEPLIINPGEGIYVKQATLSSVGLIDVAMEFTE